MHPRVINGPCNRKGIQESLPLMVLAISRGVIFALLLTAAPGQAGAAQSHAAAACAIGTNLDSITDWSTETAFSDLFKMSRRWISGAGWQWDDSRPLSLDAHGWVRSLQPGQIARTVVLSGSRNQVPSGRYILTYQGRGKLEYNGRGVRLISSALGRDIIELNPENGMFNLFIKDTDPSNYIRNIRVRQESEPEDTIFRQAFLDRLANYRVIRFMNWMATDQTMLSRWQDRPRLEDARWSINGAPVEIMVALCNRLQADPWFTLPHLADDQFVREFARAVKQSLDPKLKIYVEHSNEVWNGQFPQAQYAREQGLRLRLHDNPFQAQMLYHARRTTEIGRIFLDILGKDRVVRVLGAWAHHHWATRAMLQFDHGAGKVDAIAVAPYFGGYLGSLQQQARVEGMTLDDLFRELQTEALPKARKEIAEQIEVIRSFQLPLIAYEGGQHLIGVDPVKKNALINQLFDAANADPRMGELYKFYLNAWQELGGGLFVHYMNCSGMSVHGRFGALESLAQPIETAPKFSALQSFIRNQARQ
jgi:hypothetical protein